MLGWTIPFFAVVLFSMESVEVEMVRALDNVAGYTTEVALLLEDGQMLEGRDLERRGDLIYLELKTGRVIPLPAAAVAKIDLRVISTRAAPSGVRIFPTGRELPGSGGPPARTLTTAEQLEAFGGNASQFRQSVVDSTWQPEEGFERTSLDGFNPARWYRSPVDPGWNPVPGLTRDQDVTFFAPTRWQQNLFENSWQPSDGFKRRDAFWDRRPTAPSSASADGERAQPARDPS